MTIDEAIKHCEEIAEEAEAYKPEVTSPELSKSVCECGKEHRQLAKWLKELKEAKRLLEMAVKDMNRHNICYGIRPCNVCTENQKRPCDTFRWRYTDEALKLIGEDGESNG